MECTVCEVRPAVGRCAVCGKYLCDVCGIVCSGCGRPSCAAHSFWNSSRQPICARCESGVSAAAAAESAQRSGSDSSTAFQALDDAVPYIEEDTEAAAPPKKEISSRALTASATQGTPVWVSSIFTGGLSWVLLIPLLPFLSGANVFHGAQPWLSYCIVFLGLSTVFWAGGGMLRKAPKRERKLCLIGFVMGATAALAAFIVSAAQPAP